MKTEEMRAIAALDVLYVKSGMNGEFVVVCDPEMRVLQRDVNAAVEEIKSQRGVSQVCQNIKDDSAVLSVHFNREATHAQKGALYELLAPKFIFGTAWGEVVRNEAGKHTGTFLRIDLSPYGVAKVLEGIHAISEIKQFVPIESNDGQQVVAIGFSTQRPTRDRALIRSKVAEIAEELGIILDKPHFAIESNVVYATMPHCNLAGDPIDDEPSDA